MSIAHNSLEEEDYRIVLGIAHLITLNFVYLLMLPDLQKLDGSPADQFVAQLMAHYLYRYLKK